MPDLSRHVRPGDGVWWSQAGAEANGPRAWSRSRPPSTATG